MSKGGKGGKASAKRLARTRLRRILNGTEEAFGRLRRGITRMNWGTGPLRGGMAPRHGWSGTTMDADPWRDG